MLRLSMPAWSARATAARSTRSRLRRGRRGSAVDWAGIQAIGDALTGVRQDAILAGVLAYVAGALMYYCVLYRSRLVPRWLTGWGIAAEVPMLIACLSAAFTHTAVTSYTALILPIAVQEIALAAWLIVRGFSPRAAEARPLASCAA